MISIWGPFMLISITGAMLTLPLTPSILELLRRKDAGPLVTRKDDGDIRNFAAGFRRYIAGAQPALADCALRQSIEEVRLRDGQYALMVGVAGHCEEIDPVFPNPALFARSVWLRDQQVFLKDVYAADVLHSGAGNVFRAILGENDVFLGEESRVLRWVHAEKNLFASPGVLLSGRASAGKSICLAGGCRFERVHAPAVVTGAETQVPILPHQPASVDSTGENPQKATARTGRSRIDGDLRLRLGEMFLGNIIATGSIHVENDTQIAGSAKAHGDIRLDERANIAGSVVSSGTVHTGANCFVKGPLLAEREIHLGAGTRIGTPSVPTTVSAPRVHLAGGCVIHGTVWARVEGRVEA